MWRRDGHKTASSGGTSGALLPAAAPTTGSAPAQPPPASNPQPAPSTRSRGSTRPASRIGKAVKFTGEIHAGEDLLIDGEVNGKISITKNFLVIGVAGRVKAAVNVRSLALHGKLSGEVNTAELIEIKSTGALEGNLVTERIIIENGGILRGNCDTRDQSKATGAPPAAKGPAKKKGPVHARPVRAVPQPAPAAAAAAVNVPEGQA